VQELDDATGEQGQVPRTIIVELKGDLISVVKAGDTAIISGVVKSMNSDHFANKAGKKSMKNSLFVLYMEANHIQVVGSTFRGAEGEDPHSTAAEWSNQQLKVIQQVRSPRERSERKEARSGAARWR
jgi:DNA replicative helicase MCM subunit Mcm2 (Cdc46/Mcm family)